MPQNLETILEKKNKNHLQSMWRGKETFVLKEQLYLGRTSPTGSFLFVDSSSETLEVSMQSGVIIRAREVKKKSTLIRVEAGGNTIKQISGHRCSERGNRKKVRGDFL